MCIDSSGQIGNGDDPPADFNPDPQLVVRPAGVTWDSVAAGNGRTCALTTDGDAYCWGDNGKGQLGVGDTADRLTPTLVPRQDGGTAWASIDVGVSDANNFGGQVTCGVTAAGAAYCWGDDRDGELGNGGVNVDVSSPSPVAGGLSWSVVRAGLHHSCGVTTAGELWCWGNNRAKQLGLGPAGADFVGEPQAVLTPAGVDFVDVDPGSFMTCALSTDGDAYCWGSEDYSFALGDGNETPDNSDTPQLVVPPAGVAAGGIDYDSIDVGPDRVCAVDSAGTGWCWGADSWGALGDDAPTLNKAVPAQVGDRTGGPQDMVFNELRDRALAEPPFRLQASTTSGLPVDFTAIGACTVSGDVVTSVSAGACEITARQTGDADWDPVGPIARQFSIIDSPPPQTFDSGFIPTIVNPGGASTLTFVLAHPIGTVTADNLAFTATFGALTPSVISANTCTTGTAVLDAGTLTYSGGVLDPGEDCTISIDVTAPATAPSYPTSYSADGGYLTSDLGQSLTRGASSLLVSEGSDLEQTIRMPGFTTRLITEGPGPIPLDAVATSGLPVSYLVSGPCTEAGGELTITGVGRCAITASQAGDATYAAAPDVNRAFDIDKEMQTIEFGPLSDWPLSGGVRTVAATASSGLPVSFFAFGDCSSTGADITVSAVGSCTVRASQPDDDDYQGAASVEQTFDIVSGSQTIDFAPLADWGLFDGERTLSASATSGLVVTFATTGPCSVSGTALTVSAVGTCIVTASQAGGGAFGSAPDVQQSFEVLPGDQTIDFAVLGDWPVTTPTRTLTATASSGLAVSFAATGVCTVSGSELTITGQGVCGVTASQSGNASFNAAPDVVRGFQVVGGSQTIDFPAIADFQLQPTLALTATASSGLTVSFAAAGVCTVSGAMLSLTGAGTCAVTATQAGDSTFAAATPIERTFEVLKPQRQLWIDGPAAATTVGDPATFVVDFRTPAGYPEATGIIRFQVVGGATADIAVVNGVATWTLSDLPAGTNEVGGAYLGDANYQPTPNVVPHFHDVHTAALGITGLPATVTAGDQVTVEATGFEAAEAVTFVFNSDPVTVGVVTSSATGTASLTFTIPDVDAGSHQLTATGGTSALVANAATTLQVAPTTSTPTTVAPTTPATTQAPAPDVGTQLPATGGSGLGLIGWALTLLVVGLSVVGITRRRPA